MREHVVKVTPQQFATIQAALAKREPVYGANDYDVCCTALRSIGVEPEHNTTYRFEVVYD